MHGKSQSSILFTGTAISNLGCIYNQSLVLTRLAGARLAAQLTSAKEMKYLLLLSLLVIVGCSTTKHGEREDLKQMIAHLKEAPVEEYKEIANQFIEAGRAGDVQKLMDLTSEVTKKKQGTEYLRNHYLTDIIPGFQNIVEVFSGGKHTFVSKKETRTGSGWDILKEVRTEKKEATIQIVVLRENEELVVTAVSAK